jgi:glycosyltransferase involved in cell wall biosynthesis
MRPGAGGVEIYIKSVCEALKNRISFSVLCDRQQGLPVHEKRPEAEVYRVTPSRDAESLPGKIFDLAVNEPLREKARKKFFDELDYDLVHVHGPVCYSGTVHTGSFFYPFYDLQAWTKVEKPIVFTFHGLSEVILWYKYKNPLLQPFFDGWKLAERKNIEKARRVICVEKYAYDDLRRRKGIDSSKLIFLLNGIDLEKFKPVSKKSARKHFSKLSGLDLDGDIVFAYVNRLAKDKGIEHILKLAERLNTNLSGYKFLIVGDGPYREQVIELCKRNPNFVYLGTLPYEKIPVLLNACDYAVNPTLNPGALRANMEAIACYVPVITFEAGDRFPVIEGETGYLYRNVDELAELFGKAIKGKLEIRNFFENCAKIRESYNLRTVARKIYDTYDEILGGV